MKKLIVLLFILGSFAVKAQNNADSTYRTFNVVGDSIQMNEIKAFTVFIDDLITKLTIDSTNAQREKTALQLRIAEKNKLIIRLGKEIKYLRQQ